VIWVYAVGERPDVPPPPATGLAGAPLESVREGGLLAVLSHHAARPQVDAVDALWAHEDVVERLMTQRAVLPMRFGSQLPDVAALRRALATHHDELLTALDRVRGRVELAVRAIWADDAGHTDVTTPPVAEAPAQHDTGLRYVRAKLGLRNRADAAGAALHVQLAALAVADSRRPGLGPRELLRASYLVERPVVAEFRAAVQRLQLEHRDAAVLCTGPWPPYSFVDVTVGCGAGVGMGG
jgi:Gas vesicle synthesis protein GvpL/GvpF